MKPPHSLIALLLTAALTGCGTTRQVAPMCDVSSPVSERHARLIIARKPNAFFAEGGTVPVIIDGVKSAEIASGGYVAWDRAPGKVVVSGSGENKSDTYLDLKGGTVTCVELAIDVGILVYRDNFTVVDPGNYEKFIHYERPEPAIFPPPVQSEN